MRRKTRIIGGTLLAFGALGAILSTIGGSMSPVSADGQYELQYNYIDDGNGSLVTSSTYVPDGCDAFHNCYDYALEEVFEIFDPGNNRRQPGCLSNRTIINSPLDVEEVADCVCADLMACGYDVTCSASRPVGLNPGESMICTRVGPGDFHFMRWSQMCGHWGWTQKFIESVPLFYAHDPEEINWHHEGSWHVAFLASLNAYTSQVLYITYGESPFTVSPAAGGVGCVVTGLRSGLSLSSDGFLRVPENVNGVPVVGIAPGAFANAAGLRAIYVPPTVASIGAGAFSGCPSLSSVFLGSGASRVSLGAGAFQGCPSTLKIMADLSLGYREATDWAGAAGFLREYASDELGLCAVEYGWEGYPGSEHAQMVTMYNEGNYDESWAPEYYGTELLLVGYYLQYYLVYGELQSWSYLGMIQMRLSIDVGDAHDGQGMLLLDGDGDYVTEAEVSLGVAEFDITGFIASETDEFFLFPADESGSMIQFEPADVTLLCYQASIGDPFYAEEFLSLDWYDGYLYAS
ncbi:MAG: leucine-rich repeat protein [Bacilli bacterium]|nr:leucine-rich repeat protein [Bacilli bacterium]